MGSDFSDLFGEWEPNTGGDFAHLNDSELPESENRVRKSLDVKECKVVNIFEACYKSTDPDVVPSKTMFVLLRDVEGRELRIFILDDVAFAMHTALEDQAPDRPFSHDLMKSIVVSLGADVERVTIDDLWQDTFYARITLSQGDKTIDIDSRPSDAIALALRFKAQIFVAEAVLAAAQLD